MRNLCYNRQHRYGLRSMMYSHLGMFLHISMLQLSRSTLMGRYLRIYGLYLDQMFVDLKGIFLCRFGLMDHTMIDIQVVSIDKIVHIFLYLTDPNMAQGI
jgi:hypothetical protein